MATILDAVTRLMAPVLCFTAEEIWQYMPGAGRPESVHMAALPEPDPAREDRPLAERWNFFLDVRGEVTRALEIARADKRIGHGLDASVTLYAGGETHRRLAVFADQLSTLLIVSAATLMETAAPGDAFQAETVPELGVGIETAPGKKCARCWIHDPAVGNDAAHPDICPRCRAALDAIAASAG
jgi:isoleucyl-tRNA synthetase